MIDQSKILSLFKSTTQSYKFLWGLAILSIVNKSDDTNIKVSDITAYATIYALELTQKYKIRLSARRDSVFEKLDFNLDNLSARKDYLSNYISILSTKQRATHQKKLISYVLYRFQSEFFDLKGTDHQKQKYYEKKISTSDDQYSNSLIYQYKENTEEIILNKEWLNYFRQNYTLLKTYFTYEFSNYLQKYNISLPNLLYKVDPDASSNRQALTKQRKVWDEYVLNNKITDIFTDQSISSMKDFDLDHFMPWNFVSHNFLWNLTPINSSLNSTKSDNIIVNELYFNNLAEQQYDFYSWLKDMNKRTLLEDYTLVLLDDLPKERFIKNHIDIITNTASNAIRQGFRKVDNLKHEQN